MAAMVPQAEMMVAWKLVFLVALVGGAFLLILILALRGRRSGARATEGLPAARGNHRPQESAAPRPRSSPAFVVVLAFLGVAALVLFSLVFTMRVQKEVQVETAILHESSTPAEVLKTPILAPQEVARRPEVAVGGRDAAPGFRQTEAQLEGTAPDTSARQEAKTESASTSANAFASGALPGSVRVTVDSYRGPGVLEMRLPNLDDLAAWKASDALAPEGGERCPSWVREAAGSEDWSAGVGGLALGGRRPGVAGEIVGYSLNPSEGDPALQGQPTVLHADPASALAAARFSAARHVANLLVWEVRDALRGDPEAASRFLVPTLSSLAGDIVAFVDTSTVERFQEEIPRSYGRLHRAAVLVRIAPAELRDLARRFQATLLDAARRQTAADAVFRNQVALMVASALGLAFVVFLLYSFLNAGTKGHFAWPLRIISLGTMIVLYLGLMYLQGWIPR
jgi:hypothetical protein